MRGKRRRMGEDTLTVALAGNPNVGKSTVFNALTGMHQHTGNWSGKTVGVAVGRAVHEGESVRLVDLPGTYSLLAHSVEEEVARDHLCFGGADAVAVVCDATCLERNLNLVLQILEITDRVVVCVNLLDEAAKKGIVPDLKKLSDRLGVPVVGTVARRKRTLSQLLYQLKAVVKKTCAEHVPVVYDPRIEAAISCVENELRRRNHGTLPIRFLALRLLEGDASFLEAVRAHLGEDFPDGGIGKAISEAREKLLVAGIDGERLRDLTVCAITRSAKEKMSDIITEKNVKGREKDRKIDRVLTGRWTAYPVMLLLLAGVFYLTVVGANYPSEWLAEQFARLGELLRRGLVRSNAPPHLVGILIDGVYRVLTAVVSVMLPPMAIFFPLFTLLEDVGYLPRIAYNLDRPFCRCRACGKQSLTMCMGFGCNAAGVVGCRIIDSPRERLLAILTNSFAPCNGRFPTFILVLTIFFAGNAAGGFRVALLLTGLVLLGVAMTFIATRLLATTLLRGAPSAFTLELPPYRTPQVGKILIRSVFDRTLFVLGRAAAVAAPVGALLYLLANVRVGGVSLLAHGATFLEPVGRWMGLDGSILLGFILGFPANEIVLPIVLMIYTAQGSMPALGGLSEIGGVLAANGWTSVTALCFLLFSLMHWPCSTTVWTVKKETGSWRWTAVAVLLPTLFGFLACLLVSAVARLVGFI